MMSERSAANGSGLASVIRWTRPNVIARFHRLLDLIPYSLLALAARVFPAAVFWQSGRTKLEGWRVSENAIYLFREEYRLPLIDPVVAAHIAAFAETLFPILLAVGLASRFAAFALLGMTLVIQTLVYPDAWPTHGVWAACLLLILARGPGVVSFDWLISAMRNGRRDYAD